MVKLDIYIYIYIYIYVCVYIYIYIYMCVCVYSGCITDLFMSGIFSPRTGVLHCVNDIPGIQGMPEDQLDQSNQYVWDYHQVDLEHLKNAR